jgi:hypothetical protein
LQELINTTHKSVSDIMREAMELFKNQLVSHGQEINRKAA